MANLDAHAAATRLLIEQEQKIEDTVLQDESKLARLRLAEARTASENAQDAHARADSSFKTSLNRSKEFLAQAVATSASTAQASRRLAKLQEEHQAMHHHPGSKQASAFHHNAGVALTQAEDALKEGAHIIAPALGQAEGLLNSARKASRRHRQPQERNRPTIITGSSVGGTAIFLLALMGNLRRRDERDHATSLHTTWDRTLKEKLDDLFALKPVFDDLLPNAQEVHEDATKMGTSDPVQALRGPAAEADGNALVVLARSVCADLLPSLEESCEQLRRERRKVDWVGESLSAFSQHADDLAEDAVRGNRSEGIAHLGDDLAALGVAATSALSESTTPEIELAEKLTVETRESLGTALELSADLVLRETDLDPSETLRSARAEVAGTRAALDRGAILAPRSWKLTSSPMRPMPSLNAR